MIRDRSIACGRGDKFSRSLNHVCGAALEPCERFAQIWQLSLMNYEIAYFDLDAGRVEPVDNPFGPRLSPMS